MSLNSLASSHVARVRAGRSTAGGEDTGEGVDATNALSALIEYIPSETVVLYLAWLSAVPTITSEFPVFTKENAYWAFLLATPLLFAVIFLGKRKAAGERGLPSLQEWPWWSLFAATAAYAVWALAVPGGAYLTTEGGRVLASLLAIIASGVLGVFGGWLGKAGQ